MANSIEAQGHTVDEAIQIVLNQLGVSRDKVEIDIVHHPRRGVFGIGARRAKVRATIRESVMADGEEFDMSGGADLDDKPRRRRRRGGRNRPGGREDASESPASTPAVAAGPAPARPDGGGAGDRREGDRRGGGRRDQEGGGRSREDRRGGGRGGRGERRGDRSGGNEARPDGGRQQQVNAGRGEQQPSTDPQSGSGANRDNGGQEPREGSGQQRSGRQQPSREQGERRDRGRSRGRQQGQSREPSEKQEFSADSASGAPSTEVPREPRSSSMGTVIRPAPVDESPLDAATLEAVREKADGLVRELLAKMGFAAEVTSTIDEAAGEAVVSVRAESEGLLIGRRGQTLDSLEHIVNRMTLRGDAYVEGLVLLDIGDYRRRRRESLDELAGRLRSRAVGERRTVQVSPMSPRDRKYFAHAFVDDETVEVRALGAGFYRRVVVAPAGGGGGSGADAEQISSGGDDEGFDGGSMSTGGDAES